MDAYLLHCCLLLVGLGLVGWVVGLFGWLLLVVVCGGFDFLFVV